MSWVPALAESLSDALVPPRCAGCAAAGSWFCIACREACDPVSGGTPRLPVRAVGVYEAGLRDAIRSFKYRGERGLAAELGSLLARLIAADLAAGVPLDALVPVSLHPRRARTRGYDQAALLAAEAAMRTGLAPLAVVHRIRHARPQVELDRADRARNVDGAFVSTVGVLQGLRVALIDDVTTTGATLRAAARAARAAGARSVRAYVIAADE